jgi:hypothetical protein
MMGMGEIFPDLTRRRNFGMVAEGEREGAKTRRKPRRVR